jgi:hypothetical protein
MSYYLTLLLTLLLTFIAGKALDARSKARLGQEYVVMLKTLVARDKTQKLLDKNAVRQ